MVLLARYALASARRRARHSYASGVSGRERGTTVSQTCPPLTAGRQAWRRLMSLWLKLMTHWNRSYYILIFVKIRVEQIQSLEIGYLPVTQPPHPPFTRKISFRSFGIVIKLLRNLALINPLWLM